MPKQPISILGGLNAVADLGREERGEVSFLANLSMRGGMAVPIRAPRFMPEIDVPTDTTQVFVYRGRRIFSSKRRSYVPQFRGGREVVYWTEYGGLAQKMVDGAVAALGQQRSRYAPTVEAGVAVVPLSPKATVMSGGTLPVDTFYIRLALKTGAGIFPAGATMTAKTTDSGQKIAIEWLMPDLDDVFYGVMVFVGREKGQERYVGMADPALLRYDVMAFKDSLNELASGYDQSYPYQYLYTTLRNVNGDEDESGPSALSPETLSVAGRRITFNPWLDGTLDSPNVRHVAGTVGDPTFSFVTIEAYAGATQANPIAVASIEMEPGTSRMLITFGVDHPFCHGERVIIDMGGGLIWTGDAIELEATDDYRVAAHLPLDADTTAPGVVTGWTAYRSVDVRITGCRWNNQTGHLEFSTETAHTFSSGEKVTFESMEDPAWKNAEVEILIDPEDSKLFFVSGRRIPSDARLTSGSQGSWVEQRVRRILNVIQFSAVPSYGLPSIKDVVYLDLTEDPTVRTTCTVIGRISSTACVVDGLLPSAHTSLPTPPDDYTTGLWWIPKNDYVVARRLYRIGGTAEFRMVFEVPLAKLTFTDATADSALGQVLPTFAREDGIEYAFDAPPVGMQGLIIHNRMGFAIDPESNRVMVSVLGNLDAWAQFFWTFSHRPMALASFDQACIVLCEDGLYRMDGSSPTRLQLNRTRCQIGCRAAGTVQVLANHLIYLGEDGLVLFDGQDGITITDLRIPESFWRGRSVYLEDSMPRWPFVPALQDAAYERLRGADAPEAVPPALVPYEPSPRAPRSLRSFVVESRYYLYWAGGDPDVEAQTMLMIDFSDPKRPITTIGLKILDACVDERKQIHALLPWVP